MSGLDPIALGIMWDRLVSITDQILLSLVRMSFSSIVRESYDLSVVLFDPAGRTLAQATYSMPSFTGTAPATLRQMLARYPAASLRSGDVVVTNDPWLGTGHVYDINLMRPVLRNGLLAGYTMTITHLPDIGGRGYSAVAKDVYEEGMILPVCKLVRAGEIDEGLLDLLRANVRVKEQVLGDIMANISANEVGAQLIEEFMSEYHLDGLGSIADAVIDRSEAAMRGALAAMPDGRYENRIHFEGFDEALEMAASLHIAGDSIHVDFAGTSAPVAAGINVPLCYTRAMTLYAIKCVTTPDIPNNEGSFRPITLSVPQNCILNAQPPCATGARHIVAHFINPLIFGALIDVIPNQVQADSGMANVLNVMGQHRDGTGVSTMFFSSGGFGALHGRDGLTTTPSPANMVGTPIEVWEALTAMTVESKRIIPDSGGVGRNRGGLGQEIVLRNDTGHPMQVSCLGMRSTFAAQGLRGGGCGTLRHYHINGLEVDPKGRHDLGPGDTLTVAEAGGGGFGDPAERDLDLVLHDVLEGFVTPRAALEYYKVYVDTQKQTAERHR